jgi:hypothetical protein
MRVGLGGGSNRREGQERGGGSTSNNISFLSHYRAILYTLISILFDDLGGRYGGI